jgi:Na+/H+ antiporter NhaD/arsenite permease-like protein
VHEDLGTLLPVWSGLPFVGMLLSIALCPLLTPRLWHRHFGKIAAGWALVLALPYVARFGGAGVHDLLHVAIIDYVPFLILLAALFTIGGGIYVGGSLRGTPATNTALLAVGTVLASWVGTTGASMVMIRPVLRANRPRRHRTHTVVFFIFLVANVGGALTPLGDPPLFLGFLHGVPFTWTFGLVEEMLLVATIVLAVYFVVDRRAWRREAPEVRERPDGDDEGLYVLGAQNVLLLAGVVGAVIFSGIWAGPTLSLLGVEQTAGNLVRDGVLLAMLALSWATTPALVRAHNDFSWAPIREVAILFAGIFVTIIPVMRMLQVGEEGALGFVAHAVREPAHFFWASGVLSSFLDNAPTYLAFAQTVLGRFYPGVPVDAALPRLIAEHGEYLAAISCGSVFMGANTYIGNAPNFMVKSIAEEAGVPMPSFFGYMLRYSIPVLVTTFVVVTVVFFA